MVGTLPRAQTEHSQAATERRDDHVEEDRQDSD